MLPARNSMAKLPKNILITGSSGYVGQHLIASLILGGIGGDDGESAQIWCAFNSLPTFKTDLGDLLGTNPPHLSHPELKIDLHPSISSVNAMPGIDFSKSDCINEIQFACGEVKIDAIVHLAALSSPGFCENNESVAWQVNCPTDLLKFNAPIIYMSTDQVYEGTKQFYQEDKDETVPVNVYGRTKLAFERVLLRKSIDETEPLLSAKELGSDSSSMPDISIDNLAAPNSVILRSSLILGPDTPLKNGCRKGFPSFLQFIEDRLQSSTSTDYFVNEFRSVVHIDDVVKSIKHFLEKALFSSEKKQAHVFNLGGSTRASRYDIALEVAEHLKLDASSANAVDRPATGGGVPSPPDISMNVDKLSKELDVPKMNGLKEIIECTFK